MLHTGDMHCCCCWKKPQEVFWLRSLWMGLSEPLTFSLSTATIVLKLKMNKFQKKQKKGGAISEECNIIAGIEKIIVWAGNPTFQCKQIRKQLERKSSFHDEPLQDVCNPSAPDFLHLFLPCLAHHSLVERHQSLQQHQQWGEECRWFWKVCLMMEKIEF